MESLVISIIHKEKKEFLTYEIGDSYTPLEFGMLFEDGTRMSNQEYMSINQIPDFKDKDSLKFFLNEDKVFTPLIYPYQKHTLISFPLDKPQERILLKKSFDLGDFFFVMKDYMPQNKLSGKQKVKFQFLLFHDSHMKVCSKFTTKTLEIDFSNYYPQRSYWSALYKVLFGD